MSSSTSGFVVGSPANLYSCGYYRTTAWTTSSGPATFKYDLQVWDTFGPMYSAATGVFTAPLSGLYMISITLGCMAAAPGDTFAAGITIASVNKFSPTVAAEAGSTPIDTTVTFVERLQQNQQITTLQACTSAGLTGNTGVSNFFRASLLGQ